MHNLNNDRPRSSVFVYIFNKNFSRILLIKRNEEKRKRWGFDWGIIGGKIEVGENLISAIIRETREEIGLKLIKDDFMFSFFEEKPAEDRDHLVHFFYATVIDESEKIVVNDECGGFKWFDVENLPKSMLENPNVIIQTLKKLKKKYDKKLRNKEE